ncbi:hypothetical protein AruPA_17950 [Acidiphilium sp. PA]|uniref:hypothetical protein n=1 Tax=Acidiphilium sp. PA TaxID=2871705 RepID=UPI002244A20E|nr:hypothetical protein [Acidiphilium sp. PA]MCW8308919.1 hypothetical protein [Acidiphilium sp. PA]
MSKTKTPKNAPATPRTPRGDTPITLETIRMIAPTHIQADKISSAYALDPVDFESIRASTEEQIGLSARALEEHLDEKALQIHLDRIVNAFARSAHGAATFYSAKVSDARMETAKLANDHRDEDRDPVLGFDSRAARVREFAAKAGLNAYALMAAVTGAIDAYETVIGSDWKPYSPSGASSRNVQRQAADVELGAFGA